MTDIRPLLDVLGWSAGELARRVDVRDSTVNRWLAGTREAPPAIVAWLEGLARAVERLPEAPERPERP